MNVRNAAGVALLLGAVLRGGEIVPGAEFALNWPPVARELPVYVPEDYTPERRFPIIAFYHGLDGEPSTALMRQLTKGRGAIVVGMEYLERGLGKRTEAEREAYQKRENEQLGGVMRQLDQLLKLDHQAVFLAGVSKGGWQVSAFADTGTPRVAGYLILLAGHFPAANAPKPKLDGVPIYVGAGETDGSNPYARMADQYYSSCGAKVTWEEYAGKGHEMDPKAPRLLAWVEMEMILRGQERYDAAQAWASAALGAVKTTGAALEQYLAAEDMLGDPRWRYCSPSVGVELRALAEPLQAGQAVRDHVHSKALFDKALWREQDAHSLQDLDAALALFEEAMGRYPRTFYGGRARREVERVAANVAQARSRAAPKRAQRVPNLRRTRR